MSYSEGPPDSQSDRDEDVAEAETLDRARWSGLWQRLGARGDGLPVFTRLTAAYADPARAYHTANHIRDCLAQFDLSRNTTQPADEVEAAIWFHDVVYLPGASDNEDRSADLARSTLEEFGVWPEVTGQIARLVLVTRHVTIPTEPDAALVCDIDLSILGRPPREFAGFERRIRREYAWVPEAVYRGARSEILGGFLARGSIYQTSYFRDRYEAPARANLSRALTALGA